MKIRKAAVIALAAVIAVGLLVYIGINLGEELSPGDEKQEADMLQYAAGDITALAVSGTDRPFSLVRTTEGWQCASLEEMPLDIEVVEELTAAIAGMTADVVAGEDTREDYGLDRPVLELKVSAGSNTRTYTFGDRSSYTGKVYVSSGEMEGVYAVDAAVLDMLSFGAEYFCPVPKLAADSGVVSVSFQGETLTAFDPEAPQIFRSGYDYVVTNEYGALAAEEEAAKEIFKAAENMELLFCRAYSPTEQELEDWGLSSPEQVTVNFQEGGYTLLVGNSDGEGRRYVRLPQEESVYMVSSDTLEKLTFKSESFTVVNPLVGVDKERVISVSVRGSSGVYTVENTPENSTAIDAVLSLKSDAFSREAENYKLSGQVHVTVYCDSEFYPEIELEIVYYNEQLCLIRTWGTAGSFATIDDVDAMLQAVKNCA